MSGLFADERSAWRAKVFAATWLAYAGLYFARKPFYIAKASLGEALSLDATTLGGIGAAYLIAYAAGQFVNGALGAKFGPRVVLLTGMVVSVVANASFGFIDSAPVLMAFMALNGLAQSSGWSAGVGTMAAWFGRHERGRVMGWWATNFQVGGVGANALAAAILHAYGYQYAFFTGSAVLFAVWVLNVAWQRNRPEDVGLASVEDEATNPGLPQSSGLPPGAWTNILLVALFYFFLKFIRYALWSWAPFFLKQNFELPEDQAGYVATVFDLCGIPGVVVTGWLSDRFFGSQRASISLIMVLALAASCGVLVTLGTHSLPVFVGCMVLIGFTLYGPDALVTGAGAMDIGSRRAAALAAGIISGFGSTGSVLQELVIGKLYDKGGGDLSAIFGTLLGAAVGAVLTMSVVVARNKLGKSDV